MPKIPIEQVKKISPAVLLRLIQRAKNFLKTNDVFIDMCKEYGVDVDIIDIVPMRFGDLDVSAQTNHGIIILNYKLLCDGDFFKDISYMVHEMDHYFRQCLEDTPSQGADDGSYLDNEDEQRGFQRQIQYLDDMYGENEAESYVDHLLDHHDVKDEGEREEKKDVLMERVDG